MVDRLSLGVLVGLTAAALPWLTWIPTHAVPGDRTADVVQAPARLLMLLPMLLIACVVFSRDRWLGSFVLYGAAWQWAQAGRFWGAIEGSMIAFGALGIVMVRELPAFWRSRLALILGISGAAEAVYVTLTAFGINPLHVALGNGAGGTLGHTSYAGAFLALTAPLAPIPFLPLYALGLIASHSALAVIAAFIGVLIAHRRHRFTLCALGGVTSAIALHAREFSTDSFYSRLWAQGFLLRDWITGAPWFGWGLGSWYERGFPLQLHAHCPPPKPGVWISTCSTPAELFDVAHNEYAQLAYTTGLVGLALLIGWLWTHRAMLASPYAGSIAATMVLCVAFFPLRLAVTAAPVVVIAGLATARSSWSR